MYGVDMALDDSDLAHLEEKARFYETQAKRIRDAIEVLRSEAGDTSTRVTVPSTRRPQRETDPRYGTMPMIEQALATGEALTVPELVDRMTGLGWQTDSATPRNTVRTAVHRLLARGTIVSVEGRRYALAISVEQATDTQPAFGMRLSDV